MVNMDELLKNKNLFSLPELSQFIKTNISKSSSKVIDHMEDIDFDEDSDKDEFEDEDNPEAFLMIKMKYYRTVMMRWKTKEMF